MPLFEDIFLLSSPDLKVDCVYCNGPTSITGSTFQGIHLIAKHDCPTCKRSFFHTLPAGHDLLFPLSFDETGKLFTGEEEALQWLARPLLDSIFKGEKINVGIEREVFRQASDAIILNCLDNCFGHSFTKLWNIEVLKSRYPDRSIIVFIPKRMRWLLPDHVDEVWSFDASFVDLGKLLVNLDEEVRKNLLPRFSSVFVSKAFTHLDLEKINLKVLLKTNPFDLSKFANTIPRITFVLREDRFWHRSQMEFFVFKIFVKLKFSKRIFIRRQNSLVNRAARQIKSKLPNAEFYAAGLNRTGRLSSLITDLRMTKPTVADERHWCELYSQSHVVIGVHGSNMLIPTALAGGFVEILPRHKIRHIAEDTLINYNSRYTLFLGRHLDQFAAPALVSNHVISMLHDFAYLERNRREI
ncbi:MAG TPA: hypothetical protein VL728_01325 [Cyclobacteriaceae bacterium]|nr:hypothetical protein [Cyclobacteriaceae bacterium]